MINKPRTDRDTEQFQRENENNEKQKNDKMSHKITTMTHKTTVKNFVHCVLLTNVKEIFGLQSFANFNET